MTKPTIWWHSWTEEQRANGRQLEYATHISHTRKYIANTPQHNEFRALF